MSQKYINFLFETCLFSGFLHFSSEKTPITAKLSTSVIRKSFSCFIYHIGSLYVYRPEYYSVVM